MKAHTSVHWETIGRCCKVRKKIGQNLEALYTNIYQSIASKEQDILSQVRTEKAYLPNILSKGLRKRKAITWRHIQQKSETKPEREKA